MTNAKRKRRNAAQNMVVQAKWQVWLDELTERLTYGKTRPEREARRDVREAIEALLKKNRRMTLEDLRREHLARNMAMPVKQAIAEVDLYHAKVMQALRDEDWLVYPVTQEGWDGTYGTDYELGVAGGWGRRTYGWHLATGPDPLFEAYWTKRARPIRGGLTKLVQQSEAAALAGVVPTAIDRKVINRLPSGVR